MNRPEAMQKFDEVDLKLGIKSSLPDVKSALALAIIFAEVSNLKTDLTYSKKTDNKIEISDNMKAIILEKLNNILSSNDISQDTFIKKVNENSLFKSQLEPLIVAFELIWKYAKISFMDKKPVSSERKGGNRYEKRLSLTTNADLLHNVMDGNINEYYLVLVKWLGFSVPVKDTFENRLISTLSLFSQEAVFKLANEKEDLIFNQNGIYKSLLRGEGYVNLKSENEAKGPLRILNTFLKESLNPYLEYNKWGVTLQTDKKGVFEQYQKRVENYLTLVSKRVDTAVEDISTDKKKSLDNDTLTFKTDISLEFSHNQIVFGAPGTGKSFYINQNKDKLIGNGGGYERVTFHPDYSYANFVGTYKPTMVESNVAPLEPKEKEEIFDIILDNTVTPLEKYNFLYKKFHNRNDKLRFLPILLKYYTEETNKSYKNGESSLSIKDYNTSDNDKAIRQVIDFLEKNQPKNEIAYEYVPGPFMRTLVKALKSARTTNPKPQLLIIEEINRANVAAVFGDIFQLLDRDIDNVSEYTITPSEDIKKYLVKELGGTSYDYSEIRIPNNMFIWATMNSADQGVFPMDTAFKRRWDFKNIGIDEGENLIANKKIIIETKSTANYSIEWNDLRKSINNALASSPFKLNEDKLLGPFFISLKELETNNSQYVDSVRFKDVFKSKVIMYLFEDAAKHRRQDLFFGADEKYNRYSSVCEVFDEKGIDLFHPNISEEINRKYDL